MSAKPTAFRLDAELLEEIDKFKDFINENTKFPPRSRTDVVHFLLRKGLEAAWTPQPPKPGCEILGEFRKKAEEKKVSEPG